jgi:hypothetical protein
MGMEPARKQIETVNKQLVYHIAPDKELKNWEVVLEGKKSPKAKGLSKEKALKMARKLVEKRARPALVLVHKTRYIIETQLQFSS